jgi:HAE1 family hydrophobic/amphiphilic exporter-1
VQSGGKSYPIQVQVDSLYLTGTQSLLNLPVYSPGLQTTLQARQVGQFQLTPVPSNLTRSNRQYSASLDISLKPGAPVSVAFQKQVTEELTKAGILGGKVTFGAESRTSFNGLSNQLAASAPIAFLLSLFLAYLVMGAQFNSWKYPLYLLMPVPLALMGAVWFLWANGGGMDIFGLLGMLMLIGLSAKNAILYLDFVVERIELMPLRDALIESALLRFRPIVMTTLTVLVISFPLIFNTGQGSEFGQKMGLVMLGGILSSAVLTFFVVPSAFWLFERRRHQEKALGLVDQTLLKLDAEGTALKGE